MNSRLINATVVLLIVFNCVASIVAECPAGWKHWRNKCYQKETTGRNYHEAKQHCQDLDAEMLTIESKEENEYLRRTFGYMSVILGAQRVGNSDEWVWNDGRRVEYTNWSENEPNNWNNNEHCIQYYNSGPHAGQWNDYPCSTSDWTMCQIVLNRDKLHEIEESKHCRSIAEIVADIFNIVFDYS